jgi:hypothetical protein
MTAGLSGTLANSVLSTITGSAAFVKLHTGDPGSAGTSNASAETTRKAVTWGSPSAASIAATSTLPSWATWSAGSETITHVSYWSLVTAGVFQGSVALTASKAVTNGDTLNLTALSYTSSPVAA